ncbi:MAG: cupin domain-containing protein [Dehalococcoidia bacterium]
MAIIEKRHYEPLIDDPDDYRPNSQLALLADPESQDGAFVKEMSILFETCAPGDRIPLHTHPIEEVIVIEEGEAEVSLGDERQTVGGGGVIFIPTGVAHGLRNAGEANLRLLAVFSSTTISLQYLNRNPAPGTEGNAPQPPVSIDVHEYQRSVDAR